MRFLELENSRVKEKNVFHYALLVLLCAKTKRSELNNDL